MGILALYSSSGVIAVVAGLHNPINTTFVRTPHLENGEGPIKNYCFKWTGLIRVDGIQDQIRSCKISNYNNFGT